MTNKIKSGWKEIHHARKNEKSGPDNSRGDAGTVRASQVSGAETDERLSALSAWREAPYFTDAERAALALTEAVTRMSDRSDPVPDDVWEEAARQYDEQALSALIIAIATINLWNRLNVSTRQIAGEWMRSAEAKALLEKRKQEHELVAQ